MTTVAVILLAALVIVPLVALFRTRPRRNRCGCGKFKLARAATCFDCTLPIDC
jgi:hypothetical protein